MIFTTGLCIYHSGLISRNLTTKEELKRVYKNAFGNPFSRSWWKNVKIALWPVTSTPALLVKMKNKLLKARSNPEKLVSEKVNNIF